MGQRQDKKQHKFEPLHTNSVPANEGNSLRFIEDMQSGKSFKHKFVYVEGYVYVSYHIIISECYTISIGQSQQPANSQP